MKDLNLEIYFNESRLRMSLAGRFLVRLFTYVTYAALIVATMLFLVGDVPQLKAVGVLAGLFLLDRVRTLGRASRSLVRLPAGKVNSALYLAPAAYAALEWAVDRSAFSGGNSYLYLLKKLLSRREIQEGLSRMDVRSEDMLAQIEKQLSVPPVGKRSSAEPLAAAGFIVQAGFSEAIKTSSPEIEPKDIFSALSAVQDPEVHKIFQSFDINESDLESALLASRFRSAFSRLKAMPASLVGFLGRPHRARHRIMNRAWTARPTPLLDQFSRDITDLARSESVGFLIGHEQEYGRLVDVLARPGRPNVLLVGEPGSGKSSLAAHLAFEMIKDRVPEPL
ncbi:MAG: hypothetical protein Q8L24_01865, partial [bacterium]|nr:hypothetical protein [bacterium]